MQPQPTVTVIVTTLDEEASIEACVRRIVANLPGDGELLVVDGGTDRTGEIVEALSQEFGSVRYVRNENDRGKGHAVHVGIGQSRSDLMVQIDADLQFLPEEIDRLIEPIREGRADVVLGSRFMAGSVRRPGSTTFLRSFGNRFTSWYASLLFGRRMTDVLAGMKAWIRPVTDRTQLVCESCSYDAELPVKAVRAGFRVIDVPVTTDARQGGHSAINVFVDGLRILKDLTLFRLGVK